MSEKRTVREYLEANIPESYFQVTSGSKLPDGTTTPAWDEKGDRPDVFGVEIDRAMVTLFRDGVTEEDLSGFARSYVADYVTLRAIPALIDYYMVRTRLNDSMSRGPGVGPLGGEASTNYNRVEALERLATRIAARLSDERLDFETDTAPLIRTTTRSAFGARSSSMNDELLTDDPLLFERAAWGRDFVVRFGGLSIRETVPVTRKTPPEKL